MNYQPILALGTDDWRLGVIENHTARALTREEVEDAVRKLEAFDEMREALKDVIWQIGAFRDCSDALDDSLSEARAAISKAEGKTNGGTHARP